MSVGNRKVVAEAIMALSYVEMTAMANNIAQSIQASIEDKVPVDMTDQFEVAERLRWWAENYLAEEDSDRAAA